MQEVGKSCLQFADYCWEEDRSPKEDAIEHHEEEGESKSIAAFFKTPQIRAASVDESTTRSQTGQTGGSV